ncbi:MAG: CoA transferase [Acidimicrobiales bacterium]|nr:CoA transferase [Acidimicrobiales bacterium]
MTAQARRGPLDGITVIDLTRVLAGPFCTMVLADLGAEVIKIERPGPGDDARAIGPFVNGISAYFASLNRGKRSVALDLEDAHDRARLETLLADADVLVENFRAGTMERLGLGWESVHERHPQLVYAAISGFGHTGPYRHRPAYDVVVQGMGGIMSITGQEGGEPTRVGTSIGDIAAGLFSAIGICSALFHRALTGEAVKVDVSMLDCQVAILENAIARYVATGEVPAPLGSRHPSITPFAAFPAADGWIVIAAGNDDLFQRLCDAIGRPELSVDPRFVSNSDRTEHHAELAEELESALRTRSVAEWLLILDEAGVPRGPVNDIPKVLADPQVRARNMLVELDDPDLPGFVVAGNPIKLSDFPDFPSRGPVPRLD